MSEQKIINKTKVSLIRDDLTNLAVDAIVFYARPDLKLGSGFGNAISTRGGPSIKTELDKIGGAKVTESVLTDAGQLNSKYIIHSVGPAFQEEGTTVKLKQTINSAIKLSAEKDIKSLAFPLMGIGFYGIAPDISLSAMLETIKEYLLNNNHLEEVIICANDNREYRLAAAHFNKFN